MNDYDEGNEDKSIDIESDVSIENKEHEVTENCIARNTEFTKNNDLNASVMFR